MSRVDLFMFMGCLRTLFSVSCLPTTMVVDLGHCPAWRSSRLHSAGRTWGGVWPEIHPQWYLDWGVYPGGPICPALTIPHQLSGSGAGCCLPFILGLTFLFFSPNAVQSTVIRCPEEPCSNLWSRWFFFVLWGWSNYKIQVFPAASTVLFSSF